MDVDMPGASDTGIHELVRCAGRGDHDLSTGSLDGLVAHREGELALLHNEYLIVGVLVQIRSLTGDRVRKEKRDVHVAVEATLELVDGPVVGKLFVADYLSHIPSFVHPAAELEVALPPATSSVTPVIQEELSEARKRVASATSSGVPSRRSGISAAIRCCCSSGMKRRVRS